MKRHTTARALLLLTVALLVTACQTTQTAPPLRLVLVSMTPAGQTPHSVMLSLGDCQQRSRCELLLQVGNHSDSPVNLSADAVTAVLAGNRLVPIPPQVLLSEFQQQATESLQSQQFATPPPRALNDQSLRQRQIAEAGRTAAARLEQQSARMRELKKITTQMLKATTIAAGQEYTAYLVYDLSAMQAGQQVDIQLQLASQPYRFILRAAAQTASE